MMLGRAPTDVEPVCDVFVGQALGEELENLGFSSGGFPSRVKVS